MESIKKQWEYMAVNILEVIHGKYFTTQSKPILENNTNKAKYQRENIKTNS